MYETQGNKSLFDKQFITEFLSNIGNPLESISRVIDFEMYRDLPEDKLLNLDKKSNAGAGYFEESYCSLVKVNYRFFHLKLNPKCFIKIFCVKIIRKSNFQNCPLYYYFN